MKKLFYMLGLVLLAASCSDEYEPWVSPQANPQEDAIAISGLNAVATAAQDLATAGDEVQIFTLTDATLPDGYSLSKARVALTPANNPDAEAVTIETTVEGLANNAELQTLIVNAFGRRPVERTFNAHVYLNAEKDGAAVLVDAGEIQVVLTPTAPFISSAYYIVGDAFGWDATDAYKFKHSAADVYEDPVFTIMITTTADNQYWKIIPQSCLDAGGTWAIENAPNGVVGVEVDGDDSMEGALITTTSTGTKANAGKIAAAGTYMMTINMMDYTFTIVPVASQFYIFGDFAGWNGDGAIQNAMFPQGDNVFTYTAQFNGNVKIWAAGDFNNWGACYNTGKADDGTTAMSGTIEQSDGGAIHSPENGFYTFTLDLANMTYKWEKLADQNPATYSSISIIGNFNGWGGDVDLTQVNPHNWFGEFTQTDTGNGQLKLRANHDWGTNWGFGSDGDWAVNDANWAKVCSNGAGNIVVPAGSYYFYLNDITGEVRIVKK